MDTQGNFIVVDVLSKEDYAKAHIKGAINIPLDDLESKGDQWLTRQIDIIVYSANEKCKGADFAQEKLGTMGFRVWKLDGGLETWEKAHYPVEGDPNYHPHATTEKPKSLQPKPEPKPSEEAAPKPENGEKKAPSPPPMQGTHVPHESGPKPKPGHGLPATKKDGLPAKKKKVA